MCGQHGEAGSDKHGLEAGEEVGFAGGDGVVAGSGLVSEGGGRSVDGVNVVPEGGGAHATEGGEHPREEEAVSGGASGSVLGGFLGCSGGDDGVWVKDGGRKVGGKEGAADGEVDGGGLLGECGGEEEINLRLGGEG